MQGDDLSYELFFWGTAFAFGLAALTMAESDRKWLIRGLWVAAGTFVAAAVLWPFAGQWPSLKAAIEKVPANPFTLNILGLVIFSLMVLDFRLRAKSNARTVPDGSSKLLETKIEQLKGRLSAVEETGGTTRDILLLLHFAVYQSTVQMLDSLLDVAPVDGADTPLQLGGAFQLENAAEKEFIEIIRRRLDPGSQRRATFENLMMNAEYFAEHEIEQIPMHERPAGIDPLALRKWAIVHRQCTRAVGFLRRERAEIADNLLSQRHDLLATYSAKNR